MRRITPWWAVLLFVFLSPDLACAEPRLEISQPPKNVRTGKPVILQISVLWPQSEGDYLLSVPEPVSSNLELVRRGQSQEVFEESGAIWNRKNFVMEFTALRSGRARIEAFSVMYSLTGQTLGGQLEIPEQSIRVRDSVRPVFVGTGLGILLILLTAAFIILRKRSRRMSAPQTRPHASAEEGILKEMSVIAEKPAAPDPGSGLRELGAKFCEFLRRRYDLPPGPITESGIMRHLEGRDIHSEEKQCVFDILSEMEHFKFTGDKMTERDFKHLAAKTIRFVEGTRPSGPPAL